MTATNIKLIIATIGALICFGIGFFIAKSYYGRKVVTNTVVKTDTFISYVPVEHDVKSEPINKIIRLNNPTIITKEINRYIHDTLTQKDTATFTASDTITYNGLFVAINDVGNCGGIIQRNSKFLGKIEQKTIEKTITNTVVKKPNLFALYAGIEVANINVANYKNFAPAVSLMIKDKYNLGASYNTFNQQTNANFLIKIK